MAIIGIPRCAWRQLQLACFGDRYSSNKYLQECTGLFARLADIVRQEVGL
jgi:hypothetical protein